MTERTGHVTMSLQWGTADAEINAPSVENPQLTNVLSLWPAAGQNIATHAWPAVTFPVHSPSFLRSLPCGPEEYILIIIMNYL